MLPKILRGIYQFLLDLLFPIECLGCRQEGIWLCPECLATIEAFPASRSAAIRIPGCRKIFIATDYDQPLLARAIHFLKYKSVAELAKPLSKIIIAYWPGEKFPANTLFVPVPLHHRRQQERGFNQSALLAHQLSAHFDRPADENILRRQRHTAAQMSLNRAARLRNIKNAFQLNPKKNIAGQDIYLIDDVLTTGATLQECTRALQAGHPHSVNAIVIAHSAK